MTDTDRIIDLHKARGAKTMTDWTGRLAQSDKGILPTIANALIIFRNDPDLGGTLAFNAFTSEYILARAAPSPEDDGEILPGPYPRQWQPADVSLLLSYMQRRWSYRFASQTIEAAMVAVAELNRFHPVADWLSSLQWDRKRRLAQWLVHAFGAPDDAYHKAVGSKFLIAAVRRIFHPGAKFDCMPVLEGPQGLGKSRACRELFGAPWFSDALPHDLGSRDAALGLSGKWGIELGELDSLIRTEVETVKAFLSRETDRFRPPYGKTFVERPRQGVLIGTTNQTDYLRDASGNRRFWPIMCRIADQIWIAQNREQLWAEAVYWEARGETLWIDDIEADTAAKQHQADRLAEDPWAHRVREWIEAGSHREVRSPLILHHALGLEAGQQTRAAEMRVSNILRSDGWLNKVVWRGGKSVRLWVSPLGEEA